MIAKCWGSKSLAGVGPLGYHVPAVVGSSRHGDSSTVEQQPLTLWVVGSIPAFPLKAADNSSEIK